MLVQLKFVIKIAKGGDGDRRTVKFWIVSSQMITHVGYVQALTKGNLYLSIGPVQLLKNGPILASFC